VQIPLPLPLSVLQILCGGSIRVRNSKVVVVISKAYWQVVASKVVVVKKAVTGKLMHEADRKVLSPD
jgi:hypothetical protein